MTNVAIATSDLRVLLEVADGYTTEHGPDAVDRYAVAEDVRRAIINAKAAIRKART